VTPNFYFIFEASKSISVRGRSLKKIYRVENFRANVLKAASTLYAEEMKKRSFISAVFFYFYTLIRHENGTFRKKRSSNRRNMKTPAYSFRVDEKHFERPWSFSKR